ncbi:hypothetical protein RKE29_02185 [Streptomyces sp. B1866]|nr:hypothetical protein [Streptomyces sp. B1866]MDT3395470.1 hypothetical protein [Streptomyces sp. B1866]
MTARYDAATAGDPTPGRPATDTYEQRIVAASPLTTEQIAGEDA